MPGSPETSRPQVGRFRDALTSIFQQSRHTEIWGVDLKHAERQMLEVILEKFLRRQSTIPALQVPRAIVSLEKTLEWRRFSNPRSLLAEAESILPTLDLCHITLIEGQYVLWAKIDEMVLKGYSALYQSLMTSQQMITLGLAVMERLSMLMLHAAAGSDLEEPLASCVIEFNVHKTQNTEQEQRPFQEKVCRALEELGTTIRLYYPSILGKAYIINPCDEHLACLDIGEFLLSNTVLLNSPEELCQYLGSQIPPRYGGTGESFAKSDCFQSQLFEKQTEENTGFETPNVSAAGTDIEKTGVGKETAASATSVTSTSPEGLDEKEQKPRLIYSETIGPPSIILDPEDLQTADDLCPGKMGARIVFADSDIVVKFGHGVRLCEAEALHLASTRTTIVTPRLLSAYILDEVGYIFMSYEAGEPLQKYWDRVSEAEQTRVLEHLRNYVNQLREIPGDFIGGLDESSCRDGIFEAGYGDYTQYCYGPFPSEERFNEGIIQALRDRLPKEVLAREHDIESNFFNQDYILYQTVRGLKDHRIVFTHADLHPGNILVRADGTVVLLDWGLAGFWPEYWEFYRAMNSPPWRFSWDRMVEKFIPPFYVEYSVMKRVFAIAWS